MLTVLAAVVLATGAATAPVPKAGDIVVGFEVVDRGSSASAIGLQRVSRNGELLWGGGTTPVDVSSPGALVRSPAVCDDGQGGVLVAFEYEFTVGENAGDCDVVAQRIGPDGKLLWPRPVPVADSRGAERHPIVVSDGRGGAIVVYEWTNPKGDTDLLAQRIDGTGRRLWNEGTSPSVLAASASVERHACAIADGRGGVLVFFEWVGSDGDVDIMARRVTADGRAQWGGDDRALDVAAAGALETNPVAVPDGGAPGDAGFGAIVVFEEEPRSGEHQGDRDISAQRVSPDGVLLWGSGRSVVVSSSTGQERNPVAVADGAGGVVVAFEGTPVSGEYEGDTDILAQRLDANGRMLWNDGERSVGVSTSQNLEHAPAILPDGAGGAIVVCEVEQRGGERAGDVDIVAQHVSGTGTMVWNEGKRSALVCDSKWRERGPRVFPDGAGGVIVVYTAASVGGQFDGDVDVEAARLDGAGKLMWEDGERAVDVAESKQLERNPGAVVIGRP
jgi:hypothetical protein